MPSKKKKVPRPKKSATNKSRKRTLTKRSPTPTPLSMTAEQAYEQAMVAGCRVPHLEKFILRSPAWVCRYARNVLKGYWEQGEAAVLRDPWTIVEWAVDIRRKGRWPAGEKVLIEEKDVLAACEYAVEILDGKPWPELEDVFRSCFTDSDTPVCLYNYARLVLKGPLPADLDNRMKLLALKTPPVQEAVRYMNEKSTF